MKVLNLVQKEKELNANVSNIYGKNKSSAYETVKKEKEIFTNFAVELKLQMWPQWVITA